MTRPRQTALFVAIALAGSYTIGAVWITHPRWGWLSQFLMWSPGIAGLVVQGLRREAPRTMGFAIGKRAPWLIAFVYPFGVIAACVLLAYAIRAVTGADIIHYQPQTVHLEVYGMAATGLDLVPLRLLRNVAIIAPWLVLAIAYQYELPERLGAGRHVARAALWVGVFWCNPGRWWLPPGAIGEELGWRGWLVRTWRDRPVTGLAVSACAWAAFHVPVIVLEPPLHAVIPAAAFLLSIAAAAAVFQALYLASGSVWPPVIAHFTWNFWNPFVLGNQYGGGPSIFGGEIWLINGEGVLGMVINASITIVLVRHWLRRRPVQVHARRSWPAPATAVGSPE